MTEQTQAQQPTQIQAQQPTQINVYKAIFEVQKKAQAVQKSGKAQIGKGSMRSYSTLTDVLSTIKEQCDKNGLVISQQPLTVRGEVINRVKKDFLNKNSGESTVTDTTTQSPVLAMRTTVYHIESGESIVAEMEIPLGDGVDPQKFGSALSYARRYHIMSIFNLAQDDDDGVLSSAIRREEIEDVIKSATIDELRDMYQKETNPELRKLIMAEADKKKKTEAKGFKKPETTKETKQGQATEQQQEQVSEQVGGEISDF